MDKDLNDSKSKILKAAKKLFAQNGFDGTSTRQIVKEAGVNISLISYYFGNKENLFFSLFDNFAIGTKIDDDGNVGIINEFSYIITYIIRLRFKEPELITILQQEIIMNTKRIDTFKQLMVPTWTRVRILLDNGKRERLFEFKNINNAVSFAMSVAIFPRQNSLFIDFVEGEEDEEETVQEILIFILRGLGSK